MASEGAFWNRTAFAYDLATRKGDAGLMEAARYVASFLEPSDIVLDAACGTGAFACAVAPHTGFVAACDLAPNMVARARAKAERLGISNAAFGGADITALPFDDGTFDAAIAGNVLHLLDDPGRAVRELARVVKPDGAIIIPNYVNAEAVDRRFLAFIGALGFSAVHEWDEQGFLDFLEDTGLEALGHRSFAAKQPLCVAVCRAQRH